MSNSTIKNNEANKESTWKDFDSDKKDIKNVNYDFSSSVPSSPGSNVHVPIKNLLNKKLLNFGRGIRIYSIVLFVLCLAAGGISFAIKNLPIAIPATLIGLSAIHTGLVSTLYILVKKQPEYVPAMRNVYNPCAIISIIALGFAIGGLFTQIHLHYNMLAIIQGFFILCTNTAIMTVHSFKKTA